MREKDKRIKYYDNINSDVSVTRNIGLEKASEKYIGFVDADDYIENKIVSLLINKAEEYSCYIMSCSFERVYPYKVILEKIKLR